MMYVSGALARIVYPLHPYNTTEGLTHPHPLWYNVYMSRKEYFREYRRRTRLKLLHFLGDECAHCGFSDLRALQVDHVSGGGNTERRVAAPHSGGLNASGLWKLVRENPENYQLLCANCNWVKRVEKNEEI